MLNLNSTSAKPTAEKKVNPFYSRMTESKKSTHVCKESVEKCGKVYFPTPIRLF